MIKANVIADSINKNGNRLTTFILEFPRMILAELNTHRSFSKNSASSRAIPFETMLKMVKENPFIPIKFQKDHKGMQGNEYYEGIEHYTCVKNWLKCKDNAVESSTNNFEFPITKQLRNRILEPFLMHKVILSGTEFENFFALRAHKDAEIHMIDLAEKMLESYNLSEPKSLKEGDWHIPFGDKMDNKRIEELSVKTKVEEYKGLQKYLTESEIRQKISVARCARISYLNFEGKDDYEADVNLCNRLFSNNPKHLSPTEHVAMSLSDSTRYGNFSGFKQYRYFFENQNLTDSRVIKKEYKGDLE